MTHRFLHGNANQINHKVKVNDQVQNLAKVTGTSSKGTVQDAKLVEGMIISNHE